MNRQKNIKCLLLFEPVMMKLLKNLVVNIVIAAILLYVFNYFELWIIIELWKTVSQNPLVYIIGVYLILGFIFRIFNCPIKWILKTLSCPVNFLTLWLLSLAINVLVFYLFAFVSNTFFNGELVVHLWNILQTLILSFIMAIWTTILKKLL